MKSREDIIRQYFKGWLAQDIRLISDLFSEDAKYSECYGPIYRNKKEILEWFNDWNKNGKVLEWPIKNILGFENENVVEWHFKCDDKGKVSEFDGVSIIEFNDQNKISSVKEFQSKSEHYYPFA